MSDHFRIKREQLHETRRTRAAKRAQRLTDANVGALRKEPKAYLVWDVPRDVGLAVLVQPTGSKSFYAYYQHAPTQPMKSMSLGKVSVLTVEEAREKARDIRKKVAAGLDPRHGDPTRTASFKDLVTKWHTEVQAKRVSGDETVSFVLFHTSPWHNRPAGTIKRHEVSALLQAVRLGKGDRKAAPSSANRLHAHLHSLFAWAVDEGLPGIAEVPVKRAPPAIEALEGRDFEWFRGAKADEVIRKVWEAAGNLDRDDEMFVKLLILLPKRRNAVQAMRWEQIDSSWLWKPKAGSANKLNLDLTVPMLARRIMGPKQDEGPVFVMSDDRMQRLIDVIRKATGISDWIWHGVRHIVATKLEDVPEDGGLGVPPHIGRLVIDHPGKGDAHRGYVHATYRRPIADALEAWAAYVERTVVPGENVRLVR